MAEADSDLSGARDRIRESAKWLTGAVGAVAAVLVAGTQLSSIGSLEPGSGRFLIVVGGGVLAIAGVGAVLWAAIAALTAPAVGLKGLVGGDPPDGVQGALGDTYLLAGRDSVDKLATDYGEAITTRDAALRDHYADPANGNLHTAAKVADANLTQLAAVVRTLLDVTAYQALAHQWRHSRTMIIAGAAVAALGISAVAWAANPPDGAEGTAASGGVLTTPQAQTLTLTAAGQDVLAHELGADCPVTGPLDVLVLGKSDAGPDVLVIAAGCTPTRFLLVTAWGTVSQ